MIRIEKWAVVVIGDDPYTPPEAQLRGLHGNVHGHPDFPEGESITTSAIVKVDKAGDDVIVTTASKREYVLGEIDPEWERRYPDAKARFVNAHYRQ